MLHVLRGLKVPNWVVAIQSIGIDAVTLTASRAVDVVDNLLVRRIDDWADGERERVVVRVGVSVW